MTELRLSHRNADTNERRAVVRRGADAETARGPETPVLTLFRLVGKYGFATVLAGYLVYHLLTVQEVNATEQRKMTAEIHETTVATLTAVKESQAVAKESQRVLRVICVSVARTEAQRNLCLQQ